MKYKYGIDFGTTNSSIAFRFVGDDDLEHTFVVELRDTYPHETMPSLIYINARGEIAVGDEAVISYQRNSGKVNQKLIRKIKMDLEDKGSSLKYHIGNYEFTGDKLIGKLFEKLKEKADREAEKADIELQGVVLGVPVQFGDIQKNILLKALVSAGFYKKLSEAQRQTEFVSEPVAVAVHYGLNLEDNTNVMIFDFGGGTLDLAIINLKKQIGTDHLHPHETIAKERMTLGGEELNRLFFINSFCNHSKYGFQNISEALQLQASSPEELWDKISESQYSADFIRAIENCKCALSSDHKAKFDFIGSNKTFLEEKFFYREDFEDAISEQLNSIQDLLENMINTAVEQGKIEDRYSIDRVIVAGGSSLIPCVQELLYDYFGLNKVIAKKFDNDAVIQKLKRKKITESEVLTSIVRGLAAVGCRQDTLVEDVVDSSYGVWDDGENCFLPIIEKGIPVADTQVDRISLTGIFQEVECTDMNASEVSVQIYQKNDREAKKLGTVIIHNPGGKKYDIYMQVDKQKGTLTVMFYDTKKQMWREDIPLNERTYDLT